MKHVKRSRLKVCKKLREDVVYCSVSFDGTWKKRGHASHHGIVTSIVVETGRCVDFEVLSNICKGCSHWEKKDKESDEYIAWKTNHSATPITKEVHQPWNLLELYASLSAPLTSMVYTNYLGMEIIPLTKRFARQSRLETSKK